MANDPRLFLPSTERFTRHPQSIVQRIRGKALARIFRSHAKATESGVDEEPAWLNLTGASTDDEIEAAAKQSVPEPTEPRGLRWIQRADGSDARCPLGTTWRRWDMFGPREDDFRLLSDQDRARCVAARAASPIRHAGRLKLAWRSAGPRQVRKGAPEHIHAEATVGGHHLHIDKVERHLFGPGRSLTEFRIFVDRTLAGRGGSAGCSLGFGGGDLPAVARLGSLAVTVDAVSSIAIPIVELWKCTP